LHQRVTLPPLPELKRNINVKGGEEGNAAAANHSEGSINCEHVTTVPQVYTAKSLNTDECGTSWQAVARVLVDDAKNNAVDEPATADTHVDGKSPAGWRQYVT
jgi:hypothetical protein